MTTEYHDISIPVDASEDVKAAFFEVRDHLLRISERLNEIGKWHAYGGFQGQTATIAITTVNVWEWVTNTNHDLWSGVEGVGMEISGDIMTVKKAGDYFGVLTLTIAGTATKDFQVRLYNITQGKATDFVCGATTSGAGNYASVTLPLYFEAEAEDRLRIETTCTTDASDPTFEDAIFYLAYLHR